MFKSALLDRFALLDIANPVAECIARLASIAAISSRIGSLFGFFLMSTLRPPTYIIIIDQTEVARREETKVPD